MAKSNTNQMCMWCWTQWILFRSVKHLFMMHSTAQGTAPLVCRVLMVQRNAQTISLLYWTHWMLGLFLFWGPEISKSCSSTTLHPNDRRLYNSGCAKIASKLLTIGILHSIGLHWCVICHFAMLDIIQTLLKMFTTWLWLRLWEQSTVIEFVCSLFFGVSSSCSAIQRIQNLPVVLNNWAAFPANQIPVVQHNELKNCTQY